MSQSTAASGVTTVNMRGRDVVFLPLNWAMLKKLQTEIDYVANMGANIKQAFFTTEQREAILAVATGAIMNANPDITAEWVENNLDLSNVPRVLQAVFTTNGYVDASVAAEGEAKGEAQAAGSES